MEMHSLLTVFGYAYHFIMFTFPPPRPHLLPHPESCLISISQNPINWQLREICGGSGSGTAGAAGTGTGARLGRAPAASLRRSLALPPAGSLAAGPGSPRRSREGRRGAEDADKFPQQPQIPAQGRARRGAHGQSVPGGGRGAPGPFALRGAAGRDPMRRAREGRAIRSPGGARQRQRRRAVLQLLEAGIGRQEAAERT
ncbi:unnamed protein product [Nyctereutes procyonoides]|uniref:(raccoon dog) hypothetical protein n=1 Tax=Nyctereutes procyonoides TaxID=34880 RepID=A0A811ZG09_NYCPR|nr:unnamed protein product [Nyctereutes procyonoides]